MRLIPVVLVAAGGGLVAKVLIAGDPAAVAALGVLAVVGLALEHLAHATRRRELVDVETRAVAEATQKAQEALDERVKTLADRVQQLDNRTRRPGA